LLSGDAVSPLLRRRHDLAVMGYHFQVMTQKLSKAIDSAAQAAKSTKSARETGRPVR